MQTNLKHHAGGMNKLAPSPFSPTVTVLHISYERLSYSGDNTDNDERAHTKKLSHEDVRENVSYATPPLARNFPRLMGEERKYLCCGRYGLYVYGRFL